MMGRALLIVAMLAAGAPAAASDRPGLEPQIGARIDAAVRLTDSAGAEHAFGELLDLPGTLLVLGYHRCENLCGVLQQRLADTLRELPQGRAPRVLFASLDPGEGPAEARAMRDRLHAAAPEADLSVWRFLTGAPPALSALSRPLGMETFVRPGGDVIVHPEAVAVLTPDGRLSEVFYGFDFGPAEIDGALRRAAAGDIADAGGLRERIVLLCSGLDEAVGRVARSAWTGIWWLAVLMLAAIATALFVLWRRETR